MPKIAFMTIGILHEPLGGDRVQGFFDRVPAVFESAETSEGFVDRSVRDPISRQDSWGKLVVPQCYSHIEDPALLPSTLSIWDDLESVAAFAYHGHHGEAMSRRREWFTGHDHPTYVAWWVEDNTTLNWEVASERLDHLNQHGPTAYAFDFKAPFDAHGNPAPLNRESVRLKVAVNASTG